MLLLAQTPRFRPLCLRSTSNGPHLIDPVAFVVALVLGPIVFTALTFYLLVPLFALAVGAIPYLTVGALFFALSLRRGWDHPVDLMVAGFLANLASIPVVHHVFGLGNAYNPSDQVATFIGFGCIFAPLWSLCFAVLYRRVRREFYQT